MSDILITHPDLSFFGGAELVITELCKYLGDHQISHDVLTTRVSDHVQSLTPKTNYIPVPSSWQGKFQTGTAFSFWKYLKQHPDWDVINAHNYPAHLAAAGSSMPTVWLCNEPPSYHIQAEFGNQSAAWTKKLILSADRWFVRHRISQVVVADSFNQERFYSLYQRPSKIIRYGIDYSFFAKGDKKRVIEKYHLDNRFILLHVGLFNPYKNQMASIRCLEDILTIEPSSVLILAGQGGTPYADEVRSYVQHHHLEENIVFTGHVTREEVRDLYHCANVALFPVRSQGSWLSPFEALCAGTPVVVSPEITSSSIIREEMIGTITHDYSGAIRDIICNYSEYLKQAQNGKQWVHKNLKWDYFCQTLIDLCEMHGRR